MFKMIEEYDHERVISTFDRETGLKAIIAVHDTTLGPALGGTRMWNYESEEAALYDVLRLSRGMTFKNAAAGLNLGGGKAVIMGDCKKIKTPELLEVYGRMIESLDGSYITAEDVNTSVADMAIIRRQTKHAAGIEGLSGDPSPFTARGVYQGIKAGVKAKFGADSVKGLRFAVQGLGKVGYGVCRYLAADGAELIVYDINSAAIDRAVNELGAHKAEGNILEVDCDVFTPCALGAVISAQNASSLKCGLVAGSANNVLVDNAAGDALAQRDILYIPDFIINAGGVINVAGELDQGGYNEEAVLKKVDAIYDTVTQVIKTAKDHGMQPYMAAEKLAQDRIDSHKKN